MPSDGDIALLRFEGSTNKWKALWTLAAPEINVPEGLVLNFGPTTGAMLGAAGDKVGFLGATPVVQADVLTTADAGTADSGDATTDGVINNIRTRVGEIETVLTDLGFVAVPE